MKLEKIDLRKIQPYKHNPRYNDQAVDAVVESIKQCEYIAPIIVDEGYVILAGHTRYKALKKLGYQEAEVIIKTGLTEEQKRKYRLLDNKTNELAEWNFDLLPKELENLDFGDLDLDWGIQDEEEREKERKEISLHETISVVIDCSSDAEAEEVFIHLSEEGYACRISTL